MCLLTSLHDGGHILGVNEHATLYIGSQS